VLCVLNSVVFFFAFPFSCCQQRTCVFLFCFLADLFDMDVRVIVESVPDDASVKAPKSHTIRKRKHDYKLLRLIITTVLPSRCCPASLHLRYKCLPTKLAIILFLMCLTIAQVLYFEINNYNNQVTIQYIPGLVTHPLHNECFPPHVLFISISSTESHSLYDGPKRIEEQRSTWAKSVCYKVVTEHDVPKCVLCSTNVTDWKKRFLCKRYHGPVFTSRSQGWWCAQKTLLLALERVLLHPLSNLSSDPYNVFAYNWTVIVDDDTYVRVWNLLPLLEHLPVDIPVYIHHPKSYGGAGHIFNRKALLTLKANISQCVRSVQGGQWCMQHSDWSINDCVKEAGINILSSSALTHEPKRCRPSSATCHYMTGEMKRLWAQDQPFRESFMDMYSNTTFFNGTVHFLSSDNETPRLSSRIRDSLIQAHHIHVRTDDSSSRSTRKSNLESLRYDMRKSYSDKPNKNTHS